MGRVVDRQTVRAAITEKEETREFFAWDGFYDGVGFALHPSQRDVEMDRYGRITHVFPIVAEDEEVNGLDPDDELARMIRGEYDPDPFYDYGDAYSYSEDW